MRIHETLLTAAAAFIVSQLGCSGAAKNPKQSNHARPAARHRAEAANQKTEEEKMKEKAKAFLSSYLSKLEKLEKAQTTAYWKAANTGKAEAFEAYEKADLALKTLHSASDRYKTVLELLGQKGSLDDETVRSLEVAKLHFKANQLDGDTLKKLVEASAEIERDFSTFRGKVGEKELSNNELLEMLRKEKRSARRRQIWEALKQVGEKIGHKIVALAKLRNEAARRLGYKNFWQMKIRLQEHDPEKILAIFAELKKLTDRPFEEMKAKLDRELARKFRIRPSKLMPWHYDNPFFQAPPPSAAVDLDRFYEDRTKEEIVEIAKTFFADIGLPIADIVERSDLYERKGKDQHAFCIAIDRQGDVRTLLNIKPTAKWMDTMLHEQGHAVYYKYLDRTIPLNLREAAHILTTEGVAMLFGALAKDPRWLKDYASADPEVVDKLKDAIRQQRRREQLIFTRWTLVMLHFERALYQDPTQDLNKLWWDYVEKLQGLKRPPNRDAADWASKPHFTIAPVYYHNYMLGELFAAQLRAAIAKLVGPGAKGEELSYKGRKEIGAFLRDKVFRPAMTLRWPEFVKRSTGSPLTAKFFAAELD
jgi:peptidyl-dipeptidase A